jgi:hypothetical protein
MEKLTNLLSWYVSACERATEFATRRTFFDQAFGAVQMFNDLFPDQEEEAVALWEGTYRPEFNQLVYGV